MPIAFENATPEQLPITIEPSAAVELYWLLHAFGLGSHKSRAHPVHQDPQLAERVTGFWAPPDKSSVDTSFDELLVLASLGGAIVGIDLDHFLADLPAVCQLPRPELALSTEKPDRRETILGRLQALGRDERLRREYQRLMRDTWEAVRGTWQQEGIPVVEAACGRLRRAAERGAGLAELIPPRHWALLPPYLQFTEEALASGRLLLTPGYFAGLILVFDVPNLFLVGFSAQPDSRISLLRHRAEGIAHHLKAISDPTRLAILAYLADTPASVTELAEAFSLAQPTISAHLRQLREAELLEARNEGPRTRYVVSAARLDRLLAEARQQILGAQ